MTRYVIDIDVAHDCPLSSILENLEKHGSPRIDSYLNDGPGGGNPNLTLSFETREGAAAYLREYHRSLNYMLGSPSPDESWIHEQIVEDMDA